MVKYLKVFSILVYVALLAGCAGGPAVLSPASPGAGQIHKLTSLVFWIALAVFLVVEGLLIYAAVRFSRRTEDSMPKQTRGNRRLEIGWTLAPAIVLVVVFAVSLRTLRLVAYQPSATTAAGNVIHVRVVGHQWWWEFDYPDLNIVTADDMHVPAGAVVDLQVESADVIHSYWVPQLGGKIDAIPGHTNQTWFQATQAGTFQGQCAEFCGVEHAKMRLEVIVEPADQFQAWVAQEQAPIPTLTGVAAQGQQAFLGGACVGCHTINGTQAQGKVGPNLTHFASRKMFAGATLDNTPENLARWLANPQAVKPGNKMPDLNLTDTQISELVAFLESLK